MVVRFQVDTDFYDHPKTANLSDAAVALWTRAGSYSADKLLDGFVPEFKLASLSSSAGDAAAELVRNGLWRRVKGGHQFHQWADRNLTKEEVEADKKLSRERQKRYRQKAVSTEESQVTDPNVTRYVTRNVTRESRVSHALRNGASNQFSKSSCSELESKDHLSTASESDTPDLVTEPRSKPVKIDAAKLARVYTSRVKLSNFGSVVTTVGLALTAGYDNSDIAKALERLAADKRPVTPDTLRIEIEGKPGEMRAGPDGIVRAPSGRPIRGKGWEES